MRLELTVARPQSPSFAEPINPERLDCGAQINEPGALTLTLRGSLAGYLDEYLASNPIQTNSYLELRDLDNGTSVWSGYIIGRNARRAGGERYQITVSATDMLAKIMRCLASHGGTPLGELFKTGALALGSGTPARIPLKPLATAAPYNTWYYPDPTNTNAWHPFSAPCEACKGGLGTATSSGATTITSGSNRDQGIMPAGLCKIFGGDFFYYDGWDPATGGNYTWKNCVRGALGTTPLATASSGTIVWQALPKRVHPDVTPLLEGYAGGTAWEVIDPGNYTVNADEGRFEFLVNPLTTQLTPPLSALPTALRAAYSVYDEASASAWVLGGDSSCGVIEQLLLEPVANGGPGLSATQIDIALNRMVVPRVWLDSPLLLREMLDGLLTDPGGRLLRNVGGVETVMLGLWYEHSTGKITLRQLPLSSGPVHFLGAQDTVETVDMRDVLSGIIVTWQEDTDETQQQQCQLVQLTNSYIASGTSGSVFAPLPAAKLLDTNMGQPRLDRLALGSSSRGAAISIARGRLIQGLRRVRSREYTLRGQFDAIPALGVTAHMPDGYQGTLAEWGLSLSAREGRSLRLRVVNLTEQYR